MQALHSLVEFIDSGDRDDRLVAALVLELFEARRDQRYVLTNLAAPFVDGAGQRVLIVDDLANGVIEIVDVRIAASID